MIEKVLDLYQQYTGKVLSEAQREIYTPIAMRAVRMLEQRLGWPLDGGRDYVWVAGMATTDCSCDGIPKELGPAPEKKCKYRIYPLDARTPNLLIDPYKHLNRVFIARIDPLAAFPEAEVTEPEPEEPEDPEEPKEEETDEPMGASLDPEETEETEEPKEDDEPEDEPGEPEEPEEPEVPKDPDNCAVILADVTTEISPTFFPATIGRYIKSCARLNACQRACQPHISKCAMLLVDADWVTIDDLPGDILYILFDYIDWVAEGGLENRTIRSESVDGHSVSYGSWFTTAPYLNSADAAVIRGYMGPYGALNRKFIR